MEHTRRRPDQRPGPTFNYDRAATALATAAIYSDKVATERLKLHKVTLSRYRARMQHDQKLLTMVAEKKQRLEQQWADKLAPAITDAVQFIGRASREADHRDPDTVKAISEALKMLFGVQVTMQILDARLAERGVQIHTQRTLEPTDKGCLQRDH